MIRSDSKQFDLNNISEPLDDEVDHLETHRLSGKLKAGWVVWRDASLFPTHHSSQTRTE